MEEKVMNERRIVEVYMETTPNPESIKFVSNILLLATGSVEYTDKNAAVNCPLASQLFDFAGVKSVFVTANFVTITKEKEFDWFDIQNILREFIRGYLIAGDPVFLQTGDQNSDAGKQKVEDSERVTDEKKDAVITSENSSDIERQVKELLEEYVKPAVENDGGAIDFKSFDNGVVTLSLKGSCSGCPSSILTLKAGIEKLLKQMVPEVTEVVAE